MPVRDGGTPIAVGNYATPIMADWDGDGKQDLITGQYALGNIRFYPNVGTDSQPQFNGFQYLTDSASARITLPWG